MVKLNGMRVNLREVDTISLTLTSSKGGHVTFAMAVAVPVATQGVNTTTSLTLVLLIAFSGQWPDAEADVMSQLRLHISDWLANNIR